MGGEGRVARAGAVTSTSADLLCCGGVVSSRARVGRDGEGRALALGRRQAQAAVR